MLMFIKNKIELMHKMNSNYNVDYTHVHVYASENVIKMEISLFFIFGKICHVTLYYSTGTFVCF